MRENNLAWEYEPWGFNGTLLWKESTVFLMQNLSCSLFIKCRTLLAQLLNPCTVLQAILCLWPPHVFRITAPHAQPSPSLRTPTNRALAGLSTGWQVFYTVWHKTLPTHTLLMGDLSNHAGSCGPISVVELWPILYHTCQIFLNVTSFFFFFFFC